LVTAFTKSQIRLDGPGVDQVMGRWVVPRSLLTQSRINYFQRLN
jgi:hypothetical protein